MAHGWIRGWKTALAGTVIIAALALTALAGCAPGASTPPVAAGSVPRYQHIFLIVMENRSYDDVIGSEKAPHINALAKQYGLATNYWGVAHPSEPNYIAMIGGDTFGVSDDLSYKINALTAPNLATQLEAAGLTWKSYQQSLPYPGYTGETYPSGSALYASKHNPFMNFLGAWPASQRQAALAHVVPDSQLASDLASGSVPDFSFISPDLCHDMHGAPSCLSGLTSAGDNYVNATVDAITSSSVWRTGNTAIILAWDEADAGLSLGAPGIAAGGGHIPVVVITNHGPRGARDGAPYNHYALLLTIEDAFGLGCLRNSCPAKGNISPMTPLLAIAG
jgi:phospholipase C